MIGYSGALQDKGAMTNLGREGLSQRASRTLSGAGLCADNVIPQKNGLAAFFSTSENSVDVEFKDISIQAM